MNSIGFEPAKDWCGHQDLIRLNVLGIEGYDAVAYFDGDCEFQVGSKNGGSVTVMFSSVSESGIHRNPQESLSFCSRI